MSLPLQLLFRKLHHLQRWEADIESHLEDCEVTGRERDGTLQEKKECNAEIVKTRVEIVRSRKKKK